MAERLKREGVMGRLSISCKQCGEKLAISVSSETELVEAYTALVKLYYEHLDLRHGDFSSVLAEGEITYERDN